MSEQLSVTGMVISSLPIGDYDKCLVILTKELGKITAFARGARRTNSGIMAASRPFSFGQFKLYQGKNSYTVSSADISNYFTEITSDYEAVYYGSYFLELSNYFGSENVDGSETLKLLYLTLKALANIHLDNELIRYIFELRTFLINGEYPQVSECVKCGTKENLCVFSHQKEGVYCAECKKDAVDAIKLNTSTIYAIQYILSTPIEKLYTFKVSDIVKKELKLIMNRYCKTHIDKRLKSLELLENIVVSE